MRAHDSKRARKNNVDDFTNAYELVKSGSTFSWGTASWSHISNAIFVRILLAMLCFTTISCTNYFKAVDSSAKLIDQKRNEEARIELEQIVQDIDLDTNARFWSARFRAEVLLAKIQQDEGDIAGALERLERVSWKCRTYISDGTKESIKALAVGRVDKHDLAMTVVDYSITTLSMALDMLKDLYPKLKESLEESRVEHHLISIKRPEGFQQIDSNETEIILFTKGKGDQEISIVLGTRGMLSDEEFKPEKKKNKIGTLSGTYKSVKKGKFNVYTFAVQDRKRLLLLEFVLGFHESIEYSEVAKSFDEFIKSFEYRISG